MGGEVEIKELGKLEEVESKGEGEVLGRVKGEVEEKPGVRGRKT